MTLTEVLTADLASLRACGVTFLPSCEYSLAPKMGHLPIWGLMHESATATWMSFDWPVAERRSSFQVTLLAFPMEPGEFTPRTALGKKLRTLRQRAIAAGMRLLTQDEVLDEVRRRRGELESDETDVC